MLAAFPFTTTSGQMLVEPQLLLGVTRHINKLSFFVKPLKKGAVDLSIHISIFDMQFSIFGPCGPGN